MEFSQFSDIKGSERWTSVTEITQPPQIPAVDTGEKITSGVTYFKLQPKEPQLNLERSFKITADNRAYLLRTKPIAYYNEYCAIAKFTDKLISTTGIPAAAPIEVGACSGDTLTYSIYTWTGGQSADDYLRALPTPKQFGFGISAGKLLHRIHLMTPDVKKPSSELSESYKERLCSLISVAGEQCRNKREPFKGCLNAIAYITAALPLISDRPQTALHGTFSLSSMFIDSEGKIGLLPLKCARWGDPFSDFACINENFSYPFMRGQVKGYFGENIPNEFFGILALYMAEFAISGVLATAEGQEEEKRYAVWQAERIASDFEQFQNRLPAWY